MSLQHTTRMKMSLRGTKQSPQSEVETLRFALGDIIQLFTGERLMKKRKVLPPTCEFVSIIVMIGLYFVIPVARIIPTPWNLSGLLPLGIGLIMNIIASNAFERRQTTIKPYEESTYLVSNGLFGLTRNPMYLGLLLLLIGVAILLGALSPFIVVPVFVFLMNEIFIKTEEKMLVEKFGATYIAYQKQVRRWL